MYSYTYMDPANCDFYEVAPLEDLPTGERLIIQIGDLDILLFNIAGEVFAIGNVCSHDGNPLDDGEVKDHEIICPRHGARFDIRNGKALALPAVQDTPSYPTKVVDGKIEIGIPI